MQTPYEFDTDAGAIVYVKAIDVADLPQEVQDQADGRDHIYSVHDESGQQLALVADRKLAFVLARQHDYQPVAVH